MSRQENIIDFKKTFIIQDIKSCIWRLLLRLRLFRES